MASKKAGTKRRVAKPDDGTLSYKEVARRAKFAPKYFRERVAPAYRLDPVMKGREVYYKAEDAERVVKQIKRDRATNTKLPKGTFTPRARSRRRVTRPTQQNGVGPVIHLTMDQLRELMADPKQRFTFQVID